MDSFATFNLEKSEHVELFRLEIISQSDVSLLEEIKDSIQANSELPANARPYLYSLVENKINYLRE